MPDLDTCKLKPAFIEDFDTLSIAPRVLGSERWIAHTPWNGDFGDATFTDPGPEGPFSVSDGMLRITASRSAQERWRSGLVAAADASGRGSGVQYGYFEARMRFPPGAGTWPAFWLSSLKPTSDPQPGVEIDVIEYYGHLTDKFSTAVHVWDKDQSKAYHKVDWTSIPSNALVEEFHDYGVLITPSKLTFYLDKKPIRQVQTPNQLKTPMFPLVNLALGSGFPIDKTPNPSVLLVDHVHVYELDASSSASTCR